MTTQQTERIERLTNPVSEHDLHALAQLLVETVNGGASVSFLAPLGLEAALDWWRGTFSTADPRAIVLVAREGEKITGTVQLHPAWAPNQPHRADIAKLMVHPQCRGAGLGRRLMATIEDMARQAGFRLLTLDTKRGTAAEQLYQRLGWDRAGSIPGYALDTDGQAMHDTVIFYKNL